MDFFAGVVRMCHPAQSPLECPGFPCTSHLQVLDFIEPRCWRQPLIAVISSGVCGASPLRCLSRLAQPDYARCDAAGNVVPSRMRDGQDGTFH